MRIHARSFDGYAFVSIVVSCSRRVGRQAVCQNRGAGLNIGEKKGSQSGRLSICNDLNAASAEALGLRLLYCNRHQNLACGAASAFPRPSATNHRFVYFNDPRKFGMLREANGASKAMQHCPRGLVGAKTQKPMERFSRNAILWSRHVPGSSKPNGEGRLRAMKDGARRCRNPATARLAPPSTIFHAPPLCASTFRTRKAIRPPQPVHVIKARCIIWKPREEISIVLGVILADLRLGLCGRGCHSAILASPHLSGYPTFQMSIGFI